MKRQRSITHTFEGNIAAQRARLEAEAAELKPGPERDAIKRKIRQLEIAARLGDWLSSPGLRPPKDVSRPDENN